MSDAAVAATPAAATPSKGKRPARMSTGGMAKPKKSRTTPAHPPIAEMVNAAIASLKERNGSSSQAIKKYITSSYKVDVDRLAPFIKKYLKSGTVSGALVQTKGKGASGSFKLAKDLKKAKPVVKKPKVVKEKKAAPAKATAVAAKKTKAAKAPATPSAAKKTVAKKVVKPKSSPKKKVAKSPKSKVEKKAKALKTAAKPKTPKKKAAKPAKKVAKKAATPKK